MKFVPKNTSIWDNTDHKYVKNRLQDFVKEHHLEVEEILTTQSSTGEITYVINAVAIPIYKHKREKTNFPVVVLRLDELIEDYEITFAREYLKTDIRTGKVTFNISASGVPKMEDDENEENKNDDENSNEEDANKKEKNSC
ncbi:hypothetical protein [Mycoplasmopsis agassizii]|uniref:Uncharacterized protein n=1 Tax=Mycoplasmopsis agassizii TaxID=33922 RepID=A0ABX4H5H6_9BACT|nr:hypothetical protein [Mycoplasmopsis agassizii]PAF55062.1 hypothetical protein CJF60_00015 [Mycoplasmopsis agassizii]SMC19043.1 hypothetical protein SAMN02745179_00825 [Mycoplasmopsis agassizii]